MTLAEVSKRSAKSETETKPDPREQFHRAQPLDLSDRTHADVRPKLKMHLGRRTSQTVKSCGAAFRLCK
ncbi:hypothetical protein [Caballeronia sp. dw_276]|uniref:hypothetical protein n=1 Tax=Caballeronia sp. dw_276 TaxID=2719795 RepID=UPI001BD1E3D6|nr:hypothetical protein [Caballeronia sp. dw_276]